MADEHSKVKRLMDQRDQAVKTCTDQILRELTHVTEAVETHLNLERSTHETELVWENAFLSEEVYQEQGGVLILVGTLYYGQTINIIRFGIPLDMVDKNKEDVVKFLEQHAQQQEEMDPEEAAAVEHMISSAGGPTNFPAGEQETEDEDSSLQWGQSFDIDQLSPEQQEQLRLYSLTADNKKKRTN